MLTKSIIFCFFIIAMITTAPSTVSAQKKNDSKVLRHVVLFKFKDTSTPADVKKVEDAFAALPGKIKSIKYY